jgi:hypothetical protein
MWIGRLFTLLIAWYGFRWLNFFPVVSGGLSSSSSSTELMDSETIIESQIGFPKQRATIVYIAPDLSKYRVQLTLRFDKNYTVASPAESGTSTSELRSSSADKSLHRSKVTTIFRDKYKFECWLRYHSTAATSQHCVKKFDVSAYLLAGPVKIKFLSGVILTDVIPAYQIHATFRAVPIEAPANASLERYSSITEAFKGNAEFGLLAKTASTDGTTTIDGTVSIVDADIYTVRNSGLKEYMSRKMWPQKSKRLEFQFSVPNIPKQQYFFSTKLHFSSKVDNNFEYGGRARTFPFVISLNQERPIITNQYLGDLLGVDDNQQKCTIIITGSVTYRSCLEFYEIFPPLIGSEMGLSNVTVAIHVHYLGLTTELLQWQIVVSTTLHVLPNAFESWQNGGVNNEMISCFLADPNIISIRIRRTAYLG